MDCGVRVTSKWPYSSGSQSAKRVARRGVSPHSRDQAIGSLSLPMQSDCNPRQRQ